MGQKIPIEKVKENLFNKHDGNIEILEYSTMNGRSKFKCNICGYEWETTASCVISDGTGCYLCSLKKTSERYRFSFEYVKKYIEDAGCLLLSTDYINGKQKLKIQYVCGHSGETCFESFKKGYRCRICGHITTAKKKTKTLELVESELFEMHGDNIKMTNYKGMAEKADFECTICGYKWITSAASIITSGHGCSVCAFDNLSGDQSPLWKGGKVSVMIHLRRILREWRQQSLNITNSICLISGKKANAVHHLYSFRCIVLEAFNNLNIEFKNNLDYYSKEDLKIIDEEIIKVNQQYGFGIPIERRVHELFHKIYSVRNFTPEDFYKFQSDYLSGNIQI